MLQRTKALHIRTRRTRKKLIHILLNHFNSLTLNASHALAAILTQPPLQTARARIVNARKVSHSGHLHLSKKPKEDKGFI